MKKNIIFLLIIVLIIVGAVFYFGEEVDPEENEEVEFEEVETSYQCDEGGLEVVFFNSTEEDSYVEITLPDGEEITVTQAVSASGAKYQTEDESVVFWTKGEEAFLEEDEERVYDNCITTSNEEEDIDESEDMDKPEGEEVEIEEDLVGDWQWVKTTYNNGEEITPETDDFILTLNEDGTMSSTTDCNDLSGQFSVYEGDEIRFSKVVMTKMFCEGSLEDEYLKVINDASAYLFEDDDLVITIKYDSGSAIFKPVE